MKKLLFVCGFPSGGTDLVKTILNAHPDVYINGEMPFLKNIAKYGYGRHTTFTSIAEVRAFQRVLERVNTWGNIENIHHDFSSDIETSGELSLEEVLRTCFSRRNCKVWGNKTPQNTENIAQLSTLFPDAYFLIVVRDVRDICLSWRNKWGKDMIWCAAKWAQRMEKGWNATRSLPKEHHVFVQFEPVLLETEICCRMICEFLGIPFSGRMLEHHKYTSEYIDGKINYGREIIRDNTDKWESLLPSKIVERIEEIAFGTMNIFGYCAKFASGPKPISTIETVHGVWNDSRALLSVGNRARRRNTMAEKAEDLLFELRKRFQK